MVLTMTISWNLLNETYVFKSHQKESPLIKKDQPELNGNLSSYPLELFN